MTARLLPFDNPDDEREWQAQQRAAEQTEAVDDVLVARYRDVELGLRALPREELPPDFARSVAAEALKQDKPLCAFEYAMLIVLCVVFVIVLCCIGVSALKDAPPIGVHWFYIVSVGAVAAYLGMMRTTRVV